MSNTDKYYEEKCSSIRAIKSDEDTIINKQIGEFGSRAEWKKDSVV